MAETLRTSFRPWRYILIVAVLFCICGFLFDPHGHPWQLVVLLAALLAVVAVIWFVANLIERRNRIAQIDSRLATIATRFRDGVSGVEWIAISAEQKALRTTRATLTSWLAR